MFENTATPPKSGLNHVSQNFFRVPPVMAVTNDPLCLQDGEPNGAISGANTLEEAVEAACLELCRGRPDLLVYAFWSPKEGEPIRPLGKLFGEDAINHGELAGTLFRLGSEGTTLT